MNLPATPTIETMLRTIHREVAPQVAERLREYLGQQDKEWLIEQMVRLSLDAQPRPEQERPLWPEANAQQRLERIERVRGLALDEAGVLAFLAGVQHHNREQLLDEGYLINDPPAQGTNPIPPVCRSAKGEKLLTSAKDMLFALLFGDGETNTTLQRVQREVLTITVPHHKAAALDFLQAATELSAHGTWQDPESVSHDVHARNVILEVEYGETASESIGHGIVRSLALINALEINEQILYARMTNIEQSTLIA